MTLGEQLWFEGWKEGFIESIQKHKQNVAKMTISETQKACLLKRLDKVMEEKLKDEALALRYYRPRFS